MIAVTAMEPRERLSVAGKTHLILEVLASYLATRWRLHRAGLPETLATIRGHRSPGAPRGAERIALRLAVAVGRTLAILPTDSRCLVRALVLTDLLSRRGIASSLVIGVRSQPVFGAHAWIEYRGYPLQPTGAFRRLAEL